MQGILFFRICEITGGEQIRHRRMKRIRREEGTLGNRKRQGEALFLYFLSEQGKALLPLRNHCLVSAMFRKLRNKLLRHGEKRRHGTIEISISRRFSQTFGGPLESLCTPKVKNTHQRAAEGKKILILRRQRIQCRFFREKNTASRRYPAQLYEIADAVVAIAAAIVLRLRELPYESRIISAFYPCFYAAVIRCAGIFFSVTALNGVMQIKVRKSRMRSFGVA